MENLTLEGLYCDSVNLKPQDFDFANGQCETWESVCPDVFEWDKAKCMAFIEEHTGTLDEDQYDTLEEWQEAANEAAQESENYMPMMNYIYPLPQLKHDPRKAQALIERTNCVVVTVDDEPFLALSGGGMDLSWDICEAYMLLGYYPPVHFCRLPDFAGKSLDDNAKWVLDGCKESCRISAKWANSSLEDLERLETAMKAV